ncbi:MAG: hypothetical protein IJ973_07255, partial [Christensenellaceae bacterium]|nr:hypothetical protein [Christensenellaceae bacterium]
SKKGGVDMQIIEGKEYLAIMELFIEQFVDQSSIIYLERIKKKHRFSDGLFQKGYFWECLKERNRKNEKYCIDILSNKCEFYVMWDILSSEQICVPDYYKYPMESCLKLSFQEYLKKTNTFPEDIYLFDDTFTWCVILTHEDDGKRRYCLSVGC